MAFQPAVGGVRGGRGGESVRQVVGNQGELLGAAATELDEFVHRVVLDTVGGSVGIDDRVFLDKV